MTGCQRRARHDFRAGWSNTDQIWSQRDPGYCGCRGNGSGECPPVWRRAPPARHVARIPDNPGVGEIPLDPPIRFGMGRRRGNPCVELMFKRRIILAAQSDEPRDRLFLDRIASAEITIFIVVHRELSTARAMWASAFII